MVVTHANAPWSARFTAMGDQAEAAFEAACKNNYVRYGLNRPPLQVHKIGRLVRYTPDYLTSNALVEVQGFGQDQTTKLKHEKLAALEVWHRHHPVEVFLWDSTNQRYAFVPLDHLLDIISAHGTEGSFPEGKGYWGVHAQHIDGWVEHGDNG